MLTRRHSSGHAHKYINSGTNNRHSERPGGSSESSRPRPAATGATTGAANGQTAAGATQGMQPNKVKVEGARRVWGTLRSTTTKSVSTTISKVCGMNPEKVKRKFKKNNSDRIVRWWFVLHDSEKALSEMDAKWDQVHMHTSWKLEPCYMTQLEDATETPPPLPLPMLCNKISHSTTPALLIHIHHCLTNNNLQLQPC